MGKRTLQEIANFFDMAVAIDSDGQTYMHKVVPDLQGIEWISPNVMFELPHCLAVDFSGDWRESLTLPDSWPKEPPFREGELVFNCQMNGVMVWRDCYGSDVFRQCRRLAEEEWKVLKGEE